VTSATHSNGGGSPAPQRDFSSGGGSTPSVVGQTHTDYTAQQTLNGPRGFVNRHNESIGAFSKGRVTCIRAVGHRATIGFRIDQSSVPALVGQFRYLFVQDNGEPSASQPGPDTVILSGVPTPPQTAENCPTPLTFGLTYSGNLVVHDGDA
jgi:hypothetical protein